MNNTEYGISALENNKGENNTAFGNHSLFSMTDASCNTAVGSNALYFTVNAPHNTAVGAGSICNNTTGEINTAIGSSSLEGVEGQSVGNNNVAIGAQALYINQGSNNTSIGTYAGISNSSGSNNTFLGYNTDCLIDLSGNTGSTGYNNSVAIGANVKITASNQIVIGTTGENVVIPGTLGVTGQITTNGITNYGDILNTGNIQTQTLGVTGQTQTGTLIAGATGATGTTITNYGNILNTGNIQTQTLDVIGAGVTGAINSYAVQPAASNSTTLVPTTAWVQSAIANILPLGSIIMWSGGLTIPTNWALCDGTSETPDLRDRFIIGAGSTYNPNYTGGVSEVTLSINQMPSHSHVITDVSHNHIIINPPHSHGLNHATSSFSDDDRSNYISGAGDNTHTSDSITEISSLEAQTGITGTQNAGDGNSFNILPPYYALAFIMRIS